MNQLHEKMVELLDHVTTTLQSEKRFATILRKLVEEIAQFTNSEIVVLYPYSGTVDHGRFEDPIYRGLEKPPGPPPRRKGHTRRLLTRDKPVMEVCVDEESGQRMVWIDGKEGHSLPDLDSPLNFMKSHDIKTFVAVRLELGPKEDGESDCVKGICYVNRKRAQPFSDDEKQLILFVSRLAAIAIQFARQEAKCEMGDATLQIAKIADVQSGQDGLLAEIVRQACVLIGAQAGCLWLKTEDSPNIVRLVGPYGDAVKLKWAIPVPNSITGRFLNSGRDSDFVDDVLNNANYYATEEARDAGLRSMLLVRLLIHGKTEGALNVYSVGEPRAFGAWHESLLRSFAGLCSIVIDLHEAGRQQMMLRDNVLKIARTLNELRDLESIVQTMVNQAREIVDADCVYMYPYNPATSQFLPNRVSTKTDEIRLRIALERRRPREGGLSEEIVNLGRTIEIADTSQSNRVNRETPNMGIQSLVGYPVKHAQRILGVLYVYFKEKKQFEEAKRAFKLDSIQLLLPHVAVAIENAHLSHELKRERAKCEVQIVLGPRIGENRDETTGSGVLPWNGYIQARGAFFGAASVQIDWRRPWRDLVTEVDSIGLEASYRSSANWKQEARKCGTQVAAILRGESRENGLADGDCQMGVLGGKGRFEMARILANAFDPQLVPETKISFRIPSELMAFPFEFAYHRDYWVMDYPMSRFLVDAEQIHRESFESFLKDLVFGSAGQKLHVLLVADTDNLKGPKREAEAVMKILRNTLGGLVEIVVLAGREVTPRHIAEELRHHKYDVVHFAGHSKFNHDDPEKSFLWLGKGAMEARRFASYLQQSGTKFLYLSSCSSGESGTPPTGYPSYLGTVDAAVHRGVSTVLAYRWPLKDANAVRMADDFYQSLFSIGGDPSRALDVAVALRDARRNIRDRVDGLALDEEQTNKPETDDGAWLSPILVTQY